MSKSKIVTKTDVETSGLTPERFAWLQAQTRRHSFCATSPPVWAPCSWVPWQGNLLRR